MSASLFSCPGQEDSRFYIEWPKLWLQGYHKIMELFGCRLYHLSCNQWCDYVTFEHLKSSVVCGWMVWATVESQNSGELFTGMCNKRSHVQPLSKEEGNFFFSCVLAKKTSDVGPVLLSRQYCNVHAYIAEQVCSVDVGQSLTEGFISAPRGMAWAMRGDITTWWKSRIIALNNRLLSCFMLSDD